MVEGTKNEEKYFVHVHVGAVVIGAKINKNK